ncbi:MAG TPA: LysR substrate-binding domain-containing protein [Thermoanaerobaculia bacterium]|jgi:LysR family hydrogen peroxide-inducible transcriptional activator
MELHQLRYFVAVAEAGSFREAAAQCHVAQPSLSQQIIKLEKSLGHKLFDRLGRRIALTEAGRALLPRANAILTAVREAQRDVEKDIETGHGPLAVGAIPTIAPFLLPRTVGRFVKSFPHADLTVFEDLTEALIERLLRAELDLCILSLPIDHDQIETEPVLDDPLLVVAPREGDVAGMAEMSLEEFQDRPAVLLHEMHCLGQLIRGLCQGSGLRQRIVCHTTQLTTVQSLVALGLGISLVPRICAAGDRSRRCVYRPLRGAPSTRKIAVAWRRGRERSWLADRFLEEVRQEGERLAALDDATIFH